MPRDRGAEPSVTPPFQLDEENLGDRGLTHRVLDLRRPPMQRNLMLRYRVAMEVRKFLDANGFIDIETPMLTRARRKARARLPGASRVHDGMFFALPQSPQLFKQLLMVAGFDRYYQIVRASATRTCAPTASLSSRRSTSDLLPHRGGDPHDVRGHDPQHLQHAIGVGCRLPGDEVRRRDAPVRLGQAPTCASSSSSPSSPTP